MIAYTIVAGFLGAGKTSLITDVLARSTERTAVVVNDLGDLGFDAALIRRAGGSDGVVELDNGCICCSIGDSLAITLRELSERMPPPERIVVECSGAAEPGRVAAYGSRRVLEEPAIITVADASDILTRRDDPRFSVLVEAQLDAADLVVVSKSDLVDAEQTSQVVDWILGLPGGRRVVVGEPGELGATVASGVTVEAGRPSPPLAVEQWHVGPDVDLAGLELQLEAAGAVRAKGIIVTDDGPLAVQWAAGRLTAEAWPHGAADARVTVIR